MRQLLKVDEDGFLLFGQEIFIGLEEEFPEGYVDTPLPTNGDGHQLPFFRPKWNDEKWVDDKTQNEFDEEDYLKSLIPSDEEAFQAELEIKMMILLMEVGLL